MSNICLFWVTFEESVLTRIPTSRLVDKGQEKKICSLLCCALVGEIEDSMRTSGDIKTLLETLLGAALSAHTQVLQKTPTLTTMRECVSTFLGFAYRHIQSGPVLTAVADHLDSSFG